MNIQKKKKNESEFTGLKTVKNVMLEFRLSDGKQNKLCACITLFLYYFRLGALVQNVGKVIMSILVITCTNKMNSTILNMIFSEKRERIKVAALLISFQMSMISDFSDDFVTSAPFRQSSTNNATVNLESASFDFIREWRYFVYE